ncbi:MAG: hypothetical protein RJA92_808, partial [Bacteroidota bacterium]
MQYTHHYFLNRNAFILIFKDTNPINTINSIYMKYIVSILMGITSFQVANTQSSPIKIEPINFSKVNVTDAFWKPKMDLVATKTLDACI